MPRKNSNEMPCLLARSLGVIGEWWTLLIVRDAMMGVRRFEDFQRSLGIARNVLSDWLRKLEEHGLLERRQYETRPPRHEYHLTEKGRALGPVLLSIVQWGRDWIPDPPKMQFRNHETGAEVRVTVVDLQDGREISAGEVRPVADADADVATRNRIEFYQEMRQDKEKSDKSAS